MTQLTATFTVTIKTKPDGDYYFDHDDLVRNVVPWIEGGLDDRDDIAEVTITEQATEEAHAELRHARAALARIRQMADYWEQHLPEVIRTPAVVSALRAAMERAESAAVSAAVAPPTTTTHGLSVQHADALWDAVAIPGPRTATYPEQHERVCRAVREIIDELTPARDEEANHTDLRETVAAAIARYDYEVGLSSDGVPRRHHHGQADAVLAALQQYLDIGDAEAWCKACRRVWEGPHHHCEPAPTDQAAEIERLRAENGRMRHELEVMYGGAFDKLPEPAAVSAAVAPPTHQTTAEAALAAVEAALGDTLLPDAREEALAGIAAVLPEAADRAAVYAEVAERLAADAEQGDKDGLTRIYRRSAAKQVREWADELLRMAGETATETPAAVLTESERKMLAYALDQAQEHIWSRDGFTDEDQAAVDSLRRLTTDEPATGARQDGAHQ